MAVIKNICPNVRGQLPYHYSYSSLGQKTIQMSNNVSSLSFRGILQNGIETQVIKAKLNANINEIEESCFANCVKLEEVTAETTVSSVNDYAFYNCRNLKSVEFLNEHNRILKYVGNYAFAKSGITSMSLNLQSSVSQTGIGQYCFAECTSLASVNLMTFPYLSYHMFDGCTNLTSVTLADYHSYIGEYCFANCTKLQSIKIPKEFYGLPDHMFDGCTNLTSVEFESGSNLGLLGSSVFANCTKLTVITLPESITSVVQIDNEFLKDSNIEKIYFNGIGDDILSVAETVNKEIEYNVGQIYNTDLKNILNCATENNIPVVAWLTKGYGKGCPNCNNLHNNVLVPLDSYFKSTPYLYCSGEFEDHPNDYNELKNFMKGLGLKTPGTWAYMYLYWKKDDDTIQKWTSGSISPDTSYQDTLKNKISELFDGYTGLTEIKYVINENITTFGKNTAVTYISKEMHEYICTNTSIKASPVYRIDHYTKDNFKYGIWYYNVKELHEFAKVNNIPLMVEFSSESCTPCKMFMNMIFNTTSFQETISNTKCLFAKVDVPKDDNLKGTKDLEIIYCRDNISNRSSTNMPQFIYFDKNGSVKRYYDYNPISKDSAIKLNSDKEHILQYLNEITSDYTSNSIYNKPNIYSEELFRYYSNEENDNNGKYFICDKKTSVLSYSGILDIDKDKINTIHATGAGDGETAKNSLKSKNMILKTAYSNIAVNNSIDLPDYTYQCYTGPSTFFDKTSIIFKVIDGKVEYIYSCENNEVTVKETEIPSFESGTLYEFNDSVIAATFNQMIDEVTSNFKRPIIIFTIPATDSTIKTELVNKQTFKTWYKSKEIVIASVESSAWTSNAPKACIDFETSYGFNGTSTTNAQILMLLACSTCTADGSVEKYIQEIMTYDSTKDINFYIDKFTEFYNNSQEFL